MSDSAAESCPDVAKAHSSSKCVCIDNLSSLFRCSGFAALPLCHWPRSQGTQLRQSSVKIVPNMGSRPTMKIRDFLSGPALEVSEFENPPLEGFEPREQLLAVSKRFDLRRLT